MPYNLRLSEEVKIYQKFLDRSKFNAQIAPHTLEIASMFAVCRGSSRRPSAT